MVDVVDGAFEPSVAPIEGPAWHRIAGRLVEVGDAIEAAEASLGVVRSPEVRRSDGERQIELTALGVPLRLPGEPHLWWRFRNLTDQPLSIRSIRESTRLWLDGRSLNPHRSYDGPSHLLASRSVWGLWSLDAWVPVARRGSHRLRLEILDARSDEIELSWS